MPSLRSKDLEKGFASVLIVLVALIAVVAAYGLGKGSFKSLIPKPSPSPTITTSPVQPALKPSPQPTPAASAQLTLPNMDLSTWKEQTIEGLGLTVKVPEGWSYSPCPGAGGPTDCVTFGPPDNTPNNGGYNGSSAQVINIDTYVADADLPKLDNPNFTVPAISSSPNSTLLTDGGMRLIFKYAGVGVHYAISSSYGDRPAYDDQTMQALIENMASSVRFIGSSDCTSPATLPLKSFPSDFELINYHDSDGSDPVVKELSDNVATINKGADPRVFIVQYVKSGSSVNADTNFINSVSLINPYSGWGDSQGTGIEAVNCSKLLLPEDEAPGTVFKLAKDSTDPFGIIAYGQGGNSTKLWGQTLWNTKLLQSTRNTVYIKQGSLAQKYTATTYSTYKSSCCFGGKPAIYLYPKEDTHVNVTIEPAGKLIKTDNLYQASLNGWSVDVKKGGLIENQLSYLYYEAILDVPKPDKGYVVPFSDLFSFSRDYVTKLGLNSAEADEFIKFWREKLNYSPYYFVSNLDRQTIDKIYPLKISPSPDLLLRVELYFEPLTDKIAVEQPVLANPETRQGFTAVEWGGILDQAGN